MAAHNLPRYITPFVGRSNEIAQIVNLLNEPDCQLLSIVGLGGIGKTRLAIEIAGQLEFADGVYFVPLQALSSHEFIISAIAAVIDLQINPGSDPKQQLLDYLRDQEMLLVLDNFEHLLEGGKLLSEILAVAPRIRILTTSRERLNLIEERVAEIRELSYPRNEAETDIEAYDAVQVFAQHARRVQADFALTTVQKPAVARICNLVEGMPLALELAAAWVRVLSCEAIADEITHTIDILSSPLRNIEPRHRTMRAAFEPTWARLSDVERNVFRKLSVFRGGFTRESAERIAGSSLRTLSSLVDKSLVYVKTNGRYDIHELLRQYSEEQLGDNLAEATQTHDVHCAYYSQVLESQWPHLTSRSIKSALDKINVELENIRAAWEWAVSQLKTREIEAVLPSLWLYFELESRAQEGVQAFARAADALKAAGPACQSAYAKVLARLGALNYNLHLIDLSKSLLDESIGLLRQFEARRDLAFALQWLFFVIGKDGYPSGIPFFKESLALYTELGDDWGTGQALHVLCYSHLEKGIPEKDNETLVQAWQYAQACLEVNQRLDSPPGIGIGFRCLGQAGYWLGEYQLAFDCFQKSLDIFRDTGVHDGIVFAMWGLGASACALGSYAHARRFVYEALQYVIEHRLMGTGFYIETLLYVVGSIWLGEGETERAYAMFAMIDKECQRIGFSPSQTFMNALHQLKEDLPLHLAAAVQRGQIQDFDAVVQEVIVELAESEISAPPLVNQILLEPLTRRELEILQLVADGLSNHEIAEQLVVGLSTVKKHINHIYDKLGVKNRTGAVARARELTLLE